MKRLRLWLFFLPILLFAGFYMVPVTSAATAKYNIPDTILEPLTTDNVTPFVDAFVAENMAAAHAPDPAQVLVALERREVADGAAGVREQLGGEPARAPPARQRPRSARAPHAREQGVVVEREKALLPAVAQPRAALVAVAHARDPGPEVRAQVVPARVAHQRLGRSGRGDEQLRDLLGARDPPLDGQRAAIAQESIEEVVGGACFAVDGLEKVYESYFTAPVTVEQMLGRVFGNDADRHENRSMTQPRPEKKSDRGSRTGASFC